MPPEDKDGPVLKGPHKEIANRSKDNSGRTLLNEAKSEKPNKATPPKSRPKDKKG